MKRGQSDFTGQVIVCLFGITWGQRNRGGKTNNVVDDNTIRGFKEDMGWLDTTSDWFIYFVNWKCQWNSWKNPCGDTSSKIFRFGIAPSLDKESFEYYVTPPMVGRSSGYLYVKYKQIYGESRRQNSVLRNTCVTLNKRIYVSSDGHT